MQLVRWLERRKSQVCSGWEWAEEICADRWIELGFACVFVGVGVWMKETERKWYSNEGGRVRIIYKTNLRRVLIGVGRV